MYVLFSYFYFYKETLKKQSYLQDNSNIKSVLSYLFYGLWVLKVTTKEISRKLKKK